MSCKCIIQSGKRSGERCDRPVKADNRCGMHMKTCILTAKAPQKAKSPKPKKSAKSPKLKESPKKATQSPKKSPVPLIPKKHVKSSNPAVRARGPYSPSPRTNSTVTAEEISKLYKEVMVAQQRVKSPKRGPYSPSPRTKSTVTAEEISKLYKEVMGARQRYYSPSKVERSPSRTGEYSPARYELVGQLSLPNSIQKKITSFLRAHIQDIEKLSTVYVLQQLKFEKEHDKRFYDLARKFTKQKMCELRAQRIAREQTQWCNKLY